jgi:hypothetical protein
MAGLERCVAPNNKNTIALPDYSVELTYLGDKKIAADAGYRCTFELVEDVDPPAGVAADASIPAASAGKKYRILIHDNHAAMSTETANIGPNILGGGADLISKPSCYETNNWMRDIRPAVAFRVTIKKWAAGVQVTMSPDEVFVSWKVQDPEEEFDKVDACRNGVRPKQFLKDFFKYFKRKTNDASSKVDDNCSVMFGGVRQRDGVVDARDVLFEIPFSAVIARAGGGTLPRLEDPPGTPSSDPYRGRRAKSGVKPETGPDGKPIGVSDVIFYPPAISGDNYVFSIGLASPSGAKLDFIDPDGKRVKSYETGPFTNWRKITIDLLVTFDNISANAINWTDVKNAYAAAFIEVVPPAGASIVQFDEDTWKKVVRKYLADIGKPNAVINDNTLYDYGTYFLPALPGLTKDDCWNYGKQLAMKFLDRAYKDKNKASPRTDLLQDDSPGLYVFLAKDMQAISEALGMYMGEREFFMVTVGDLTCTFAHEMGHAVYLRHALTSFDTSNADPTKWTTKDVDHTRGAWLDHDQKEAIVCTMSYENDYYGSDGVTPRVGDGVEWHFCAVCLLKLRFWDTVKLRGNAQFRKLIYAQIKPLKLASPIDKDLAGFNMPAGTKGYISCYAPAEATVNNKGGIFRKEVTNMTDGEWKSSVSARADFVTYVVNGVTYYDCLQADAAKKGSTQVSFTIVSYDLKSNSVTGKVT